MPPSSTPIAAPEPAIAPRMPSALFRSGPSSNVTNVMEKTEGDRMAAAAPWSARAAISMPSEVEKPHGTARAAKETGRATKTRRLQRTSPAHVARAAAEQQEAAEGERVAADHPLEVLRREVEVFLDLGECHVDDRDVQNDHQVRDSEYCERLPAAWIRGHASPLVTGLT